MEQYSIRKFQTFVFPSLFLFLFLYLFLCPVRAESFGSITILTKDKVEVSKIAEKRNGEYVILLPNCNVELHDNMSADEIRRAAEELEKIEKKEIEKESEGGHVVFDNLEDGVYLITVPNALPSLVEICGNDIQIDPKIEENVPKFNGVINVAKELQCNMLPVAPSEKVVFYVGLFEDADFTKLITKKPLVFNNTDKAYTSFENLENNTTYYIAEVDEEGNVITEITEAEELCIIPEYPDGQKINLKDKADFFFINNLIDMPEQYYYCGRLEIIKKTTKNGYEYPTDETFYVSAFSDPGFKNRCGDVIELRMNGKSSLSIINDDIPVFQNSITFYVAETDKSGIPLKNTEFNIKYDKQKIVLTPDNPEEKVVIINDFTTSGVTTSEVSENESNAPKTGDTSNILIYILMLGVSLTSVIYILNIKKRRNF